MQHQVTLDKQTYPNDFAASLATVGSLQPGCCILSCLGAPFGLTSCYMRKLVLESYHGGVPDFVCCQGYIPGFCGINPPEFFPGSEVGLCLEGCCCPIFSLSIARIHMMDTKNIRPDPMDYQIIACANCLQLLACLCQCAALLDDNFQEAANLIDLIADIITLSVAGCMGAQIYHEVKTDPNARGPANQAIERGYGETSPLYPKVAVGTPVEAVAVPMQQPPGGGGGSASGGGDPLS